MAQLPEQSYEKHAKWAPAFHQVQMPLLMATLIGSIVNLYQSIGDHERIYNASLIVALTIAVTMSTFFARIFALQAQDRVIRAEENMRHYLLTGKALDPRLTVKQLVGLRFASDGEFVELACRAAETGMVPADIKKAVKNWRADHDRL
jgi:L-cystine uptake protein TcyP (sodium:dicarboxylate symporter family)